MSHRSHITRQQHWRQSNYGKRTISTYGVHKQVANEFKEQHFMSHRQMRMYWDEPHSELYYPLSLYSRYLKYHVTREKAHE